MNRVRDEMTPYGPLASGAKGGPMTSSYWVVAGSLAAGAHPSSRSPDGVDSLVLAGIDTIVDLTDIDSGSRAPMSLRSHPIADLGVPSAPEMVSILDSVDSALGTGRGVYVHCLAGVGRTGIVVGCWLVRHRMCPPRGATDLVARLRGQAGLGSARSPETDQQAEFVQSWLPGH